MSIEKRELSSAENKTARSMLFDYYGQLLSDRQNEVFRLYFEEDYSLSEIAAELNISRQGVHDALKKAEASLVSFEEKLKLIAKHEEYLTVLKKINDIVKQLVAEEKLSVNADNNSGSAGSKAKKSENLSEKKIHKLLHEMETTVSNLDI